MTRLPVPLEIFRQRERNHCEQLWPMQTRGELLCVQRRERMGEERLDEIMHPEIESTLL